MDNLIDDPQCADIVKEMHRELVRHMRKCGDRVAIREPGPPGD